MLDINKPVIIPQPYVIPPGNLENNENLKNVFLKVTISTRNQLPSQKHGYCLRIFYSIRLSSRRVCFPTSIQMPERSPRSRQHREELAAWVSSNADPSKELPSRASLIQESRKTSWGIKEHNKVQASYHKKQFSGNHCRAARHMRYE